MEQLQQLLENKLMSMQPCPSAVAQGFNYMLPQQMSMTPQSLQILPQMVGNSQVTYMMPRMLTVPNPSPQPHGELLSMPSSSCQGKMRTIFTKEQVDVMEAVFQITHFPEPEIRRRIAEELDLHETRVTTWYKNRRQKKRQSDKQMLKATISAQMDSTPIKLELVADEYQPQPVSVLLSEPDHTPVTSPAESYSTVL